ncbi:MAG TPA: SBBP repeat-containing protein, partial [Thermoanaerobaculia bacterium]|nr:SBBP repeat-containing protein [Thermoanaerobaculia bacterium]
MPDLAAGRWRCTSLLLLLIASTLQAYGKLPLAFEPNVGQSDRRVAFIARGSGVQLFLTPNEAVYRLPETIVRMQLVGANRVRARGTNRLPSESNYLDRRPSITHVPHFSRVEMRQIYRGIDLAYYGNDSQLEYDFIVAPHADPSRIAFDIQGAEEIGIGEEGELRIRTSSGTIVWHAPAIYQSESRIAGSYALCGKNRIGFHVSSYDHSQPLIIDPILAWSKSIGGTGIDHAYAVAVDASECAVITGDTASTDFPTTAGAYKTTGGGVFVSKLNAAGTSLVYSTFLGPGKGLAIALRGGNAYIAGVGTSAFPVTAGAFSDFATGNNVFVTELTSDGSALVYSALFGKGSSQGAGIAVDAMGNAYVTGTTVTDNFTTTSNAFQPTRPTLGQVYQGDIDAFFVKLNSSGSTLLYSTYLGSTQNDFGNG